MYEYENAHHISDEIGKIRTKTESGQLKQLWYIHTMEYCVTIKKKRGNSFYVDTADA